MKMDKFGLRGQMDPVPKKGHPFKIAFALTEKLFSSKNLDSIRLPTATICGYLSTVCLRFNGNTPNLFTATAGERLRHLAIVSLI